MKQLYLECKTGAAGDMLMAALFSLLSVSQQAEFLEKMNRINETIKVVPEDVKRQGIGGTQMHVVLNGEEESSHNEHAHSHTQEHAHSHSHTHTSLQESSHNEHTHEHSHSHTHTSCTSILEQIEKLDLPEDVKKNAAAIYHVIAQAESTVHRTQISQIHFHEIGSLDALADVVGCSLAISYLGAEKIVCSPICVGNGNICCAHGILPVPAPATTEIIKGMPVYSSSFDGELLTPTGAAVLKHFAQDFSKEFQMQITAVGYGFGTKEFEQLSFVRAFLGNSYT